MKKLLVLNGQFYAGKDAEKNTLKFVGKRDEAAVIESKVELDNIFDAIKSWMVDEIVDVRRIEVLNVV